MKAIVRRCKNMQWLCQRPSSYSIGQFNHIGFVISHTTPPRIICKVISALGLGKQWGNLWNLKRVEAQGIVEYVARWFDRSPEEYFRPLQLGRKLNYTLCLPFEHALYRLHIYTDLHISRHFDVPAPGRSTTSHAADVMLLKLKEDCEKLSHSTSHNDRLSLLEGHAKALFNGSEPDSACPFEPVVLAGNGGSDLKRSLEEIREMWMRLLIYAAGKCSGELHARQLGKGGELLTFVWLLMLHHGLGDAATEVNLLTSDDPGLPKLGSVVAAQGGNFGPRPEQPRYAFDFRHP
jgi:hypothetical protein